MSTGLDKQSSTLRFEAIAMFQRLEKNYRVSSWELHGLHIWPILRIKIGHEIARRGLASSEQVVDRPPMEKLRMLTWGLQEYLVTKRNLAATDVAFLGSYSHEVAMENRPYNRFFEPLLEEELTQQLHTTYLQYGYKEAMRCNKGAFDQLFGTMSLHVFAQLGLKVGRKRMAEDWWKDFLLLPDVEVVFEKLQEQLELSSSTLKKYVLSSFNIHLRSQQYGKLFKDLKPKVLVCLYFYGNDGLAAVYAAKRQGILTVDMQHGPLRNATYSAWYNVPSKGFNVFPDIFWTWDKNSSQNLSDWTRETAHAVVIGGNPWVEYWRDLRGDVAARTKNSGVSKVLYTIQPLTTIQLFFDELIDCIRSRDDLMWVVRLHPRQDAAQIQEIEKHLTAKGVWDKVELESALSSPLPLSLSSSSVHLTNYSGTAIEASILGVKTILLHDRGAKVYSDLVKQKQALVLDTGNSLNELLDEILDTPTVTHNSHSISPSQVLLDLVKQAHA
ncbi:hypothetical protein [Lewinella sp. 4G2]|uniref:hypothetical protein n=1 Tax=Lewinella sp. 4G2 TaxID=1803372 RepID=UPI0007B48194|nr:hypothetical protein [Lewinella sp. 4G2]OAV44304.1 hypothetical protein A3850_007265 [Lewinella sp. 4G2]